MSDPAINLLRSGIAHLQDGQKAKGERLVIAALDKFEHEQTSLSTESARKEADHIATHYAKEEQVDTGDLPNQRKSYKAYTYVCDAHPVGEHVRDVGAMEYDLLAKVVIAVPHMLNCWIRGCQNNLSQVRLVEVEKE